MSAWCGGAVLAALVVLGVDARAESATPASIAKDLDGKLREQTAGLEARASTLADLPRLRSAVATDSATVRDLTQEELMFRPRPGEVIEIGQVLKGQQPVSLWKTTDGASNIPLDQPGVHLVIAGNELRLAVVKEVTPKDRADELAGRLAVTALVDTAPFVEALKAIGAGATLEVRGQTLVLGGAGPEGGVDETLPLTSAAGAEARLVVRAARGAATVAVNPAATAGGAGEGRMSLVAAGGGALALLLILGVVVATRGKKRAAGAGATAVIAASTDPGAATGSRSLNAASTDASASAGGLHSGFATGSSNVTSEGAHAMTEFGVRGPTTPTSPLVSQSMPAVASSNAPGGRRVGRYALVKPLGSGGMAEVYLARVTGEAGFEKLVALKVMLKHIAQDQRLVEHFLDEARLASHLTHPNIVQIIDLGRAADDEYFIAMEYIEGADLERLLEGARAADRQVPVRIALNVIRKICDGLHAAHTATTAEGMPLQIVHRDVKSANVFIARNGAVKIGDFGIAKASQEARIHRTRVGEVKGTAAYMPPEQRVGEVVDARADLYSAGAIAYEILTGRLIELDFMRLAHLGLQGWPHLQPPSEVRPELPVELDAIVFKALAYDKNDRYPDCATLEEAFEQVATKYNLVGTDKQVAQWVESELGTVAAGRSLAGSAVDPSRAG